jgi:hypothetical protein
MNDITRGSLTSETQIELNWAAITLDADTGGSQIISYNVQWDVGNNGLYPSTDVDLVGYISYYPGTSFIISSGIVAGQSYNFRIRAQNIYGLGVFSANIVTLTATGIPAKMSPATTAVTGTSVRVSWIAPYANSEPLTKYRVYLIAHDGSENLESVNCDAYSGTAPASTIFSQQYCDIPTATLTGAPYSLIF